MRRCFLLLLLTGCQTGDVDRLLSRKPAKPPGREPSLSAAARVDQVGRAILAANPFSADVTFQTIGADEAAILHRDAYGVFITDALVDRCKTESELAAVLCSELGAMMAEKRNATRMGIPETILDVPGGATAGEMGGITSDQVRLAELGMMEQKHPKKLASAAKEQFTDPRKIAVDLFRTAGYKDEEYARGEAILKDTTKDGPTVRQIAGSGLIPKWSR